MFGVEEARAAGKFAKTADEKTIVLSTVSMLGIDTDLSRGVCKVRSAAYRRLGRNNKAIVKLNNKLRRLLKLEANIVSEITEADEIYLQWNL